MPIVYHIRDSVTKAPKHTLAFEYDPKTNAICVGWAKPSKGDTVSKKMGYNIATKRCTRVKEFLNGTKKNALSFSKVPHDVLKSIKKNVPRVYRYFKDAEAYDACFKIYNSGLQIFKKD